MAVDNSQSEEIDLERTDRLPVLAGGQFDDDVEDDAVRMDYAAPQPGKRDFPRPSGLDLPLLAESIRSVEDRIACQNAEYESLSRSYDAACEAQAVATARAQALSAELAGLRSTFESVEARSRDAERAMAEKTAAAETARLRSENALRDVERHQSESQTLRDALAARDATIVQVLNALGERDAQILALQRDHAQMAPVLEERSKVGSRLEDDLRAARARSDALAADVKNSMASVAALTAQRGAAEREIEATRRELGIAKSEAATYLETLRTREWRRGFDLNMFRELDAKIGTAQEQQGVLQGERDVLLQRVADVELKLAARDKSIAKLKTGAVADEALHVKRERELQQTERARAELAAKLAAVEGERNLLRDALAAQQVSLVKPGVAAAVEAPRQLREPDLHDLVGAPAAQEVSPAGPGAAAAVETPRQQHESERQDLDGAPAVLIRQIAALQEERGRLLGELAAKDLATVAAPAGASQAERIEASLASAEQGRLELLEQIQKMQLESKVREDQMSMLMAHLEEARRPIEGIEAEMKRLSDELFAKTAVLEAFTEDNRILRLDVERTRAALEERESRIRRVERGDLPKANGLGRNQTAIERLGRTTDTPPGMATPAPVECSAELARVDGHHNTAYPLARRTRIGRAPGCELQINSSSISRHHALVLMGQREVVVEDLNSTNGVLVNGRKISRQMLNDGDMVTIGEAQFRFSLTLTPSAAGSPEAN